MSKEQNRAETLEKEFNEFVKIWYESEKNIELKTVTWDTLDLSKIVLLKSALSTVNNIATLKTTELLLKRLTILFQIGNEENEAIRRTVLSKSASENGFDVEWSGEITFVAEVKCNIPINEGNEYGSAQKQGIKNDLKKLRHGNDKSKKKGMNAKALEKYYKFLGVFCPDDKSREAVRKFHKSPGNQSGTEILSSSAQMKDIDTDTVYIVLLK